MTIIEIYDSESADHKKWKKCASKDMEEYTEKYGCHFNKALCEFAVGRMTKDGSKIAMVDKAVVDSLLQSYNISITNNRHYDTVFVYHMAKADYWGSSITDDMHLAKYIKDVLDDSDGYEGVAFNRWYADMCKCDVDIDWESML